MMDSTIPLIHYEITLQNHLPKKGADPNYPSTHLLGRDATYIPAYRHMDVVGHFSPLFNHEWMWSCPDKSEEKQTVHAALCGLPWPRYSMPVARSAKSCT
jgi:hypothetical protein